MKAFAFLAMAPMVVSCSLVGPSSEVAKCEEQILAKLDNPDSYARDQNDSLSLGDRWQVGIEFSFVDQSGERVAKAWQTCEFPIIKGKPDTSEFLKLESSLDAAKNFPSE